MKNNIKPYFPTLDGLRFFAFLLIFLHHVTFYMQQDYATNSITSFLHSNGWIGVSFFFSLTGFLTTYLLLVEKEKLGRIDIKSYQIKRILRIWPLYFIAIIVGYCFYFFISGGFGKNPGEYVLDVKQHFPWFLTFLGNWGIALNSWGGSRAISELWAVCVDQQFYLLWPFAVLLMKNFRRSIWVSLLLISFSILFRGFLLSTGTGHPQVYVNSLNWLDTFTFGALAAQILFFKPAFFEKFKFLYSTFLQIFVMAFLIVYLYVLTISNNVGSRVDVWSYSFIGLIATYLIVCGISSNSVLSIVFKNNFFVKLGKLGYGLYVWHILALEIIFYTIGKSGNDYFLIFLGLPLTVIFAILSSRLIEKPFLHLKTHVEK